MTIHLQPFRETQLAALQDLFEASSSYFSWRRGQPVQRSDEAAQHFLTVQQDRGRELWGIFLEPQKTLIGCLEFHLHHPVQQVTSLELILIRDDHRRRGYGRMALEQWEGWLKKQHRMQGVRVNVGRRTSDVGGEGGSEVGRGFLEAMGFRPRPGEEGVWEKELRPPLVRLDPRRPEPVGELQLIGQRLPLVDGSRKVTGEGLYTDDIKLPGMLTGKILRSLLPHARIVRLDTARAVALPGVRAVVTGREAPVRFGVLPISKDETALAVDKVRYIGDCVAAVAADDEEIALQALQLIQVEYEELPVYLQPEAGLQEVREKIYDHTPGNTNVHKAVDQQFGDVDQALGDSRLVVTRDFSFIGLNHAFTEPHAVVAHFDSSGRLTVWSAQQVPHYLHRTLAEVLGMPMHAIRVIRPMVGGGFGGKSDPFPHEVIAALLARKSGRPVKILFDREEVFLTNHGRHPTKQKVTIGLDEQGLVQAMDIQALIDGGAWASFGVVTTYYNGILSQGPYYVPNFRYSGKRVYTNKAPCGAMRAHGAVNTRFAVEVILDILAEQAGIDPCELRLRNVLPAYSVLPNGFRITSNGLKECIEKVRAASGWDGKFLKLPYGEGVGLGCGFYISGSALPIHRSRLPQSTVHLKIDMDGGVTVHSGAAEIGQGSDTVIALCVAEVLGVRLDRIRVYSSDSDLAPIDLGSYSSRVTFMAGNAARRAAEQIRCQLVAAAARLTGHNKDVFVLKDEMLYNTADPDRSVTYMQALEEALANSGALIAKGCYQSPPLGGTYKGATAGLSPSYSFNAYIAQVQVDPDTGFIQVRKVWAAHDCGRALNRLAVEGQIEGSIYMGLGQVLMEAMPYTRDGNIQTPNFLDYKCLGPLEMPEIEVFIVESHDPEGPFGAKEAGEGPLLPILPAVANAVYDAVGVRLYDLPLTPDRVLNALELKGRGKSYDTARVPVL